MSNESNTYVSNYLKKIIKKNEAMLFKTLIKFQNTKDRSFFVKGRG